MRRLLVSIPLILLAACGLNGTDRDQDKQAASPSQASGFNDPLASRDPAAEAPAEADMPDPVQRPEMALQVVLDRQGFGPGVIDGKMGLSTENALSGFQEANGFEVTGKLDDQTRQALEQWNNIPATRVVRIPESWAQASYQPTPDKPEDQAKLQQLGYQSLDERLAERFHTTIDVLKELNPGGQPAGSPAAPATPAITATPTRTPSASNVPEPSLFRAGQMVRVPNIGADQIDAGSVDDQAWLQTLASLGVGTEQPDVAKIVVDKSSGWLKGYDKANKLVAMFTVTSGSSHDPLPLGDWKVLGVSRNPPFHYNPDLFWDASAGDEKAKLPPGPNGPVGVVWIDLSKEHYGIHGTPEPQTIGRSQSHGCVRLTNWDAARLAGMVNGSTTVVFQA